MLMDMEMEDEDRKTFARYLVGELLRELEQFDVGVAELKNAQAEQFEVLSFSGYKLLRIRVASAVFDAHLSWRRDVPPIIERVLTF
jgi:hypothetical protein